MFFLLQVLDGNADLSDMYKIYDKNKLTILGGYTWKMWTHRMGFFVFTGAEI